jgi:lipopolysaccharide export system permease protein
VKIIHRYVLREHVGPLTFALSALTSLLLLNYIAKQFGNLVGKGLPGGIIAQFFLLSIPFTVAMTTPMSVLVATLYAFSRLAAENEVTALKANGISMVRLLVPVLLAAALISVGMIAFNDIVLPRANHRLRTLQGDIARKKPTFGLREQIINEVSPGQFFLRANHLEQATNRMRDITIEDLSDPMRRKTIHADSGTLAFEANGNDLLLTLYSGYIIEVPRAEPRRLQRLYFQTNFVRVADVANQLETTGQDSYKSDREMSICELQNEVSRYELEYEQARTDLQRALLAVVREAISGVPVTPPEMSQPASFSLNPGAPAPRSRNFSLGRLYCDGIIAWRKLRARVAAVGVVYAAEPGQQGGPVPPRDTGQGAPRSQDSTRRSGVRADSAQNPVPAPVPPVTPPGVLPTVQDSAVQDTTRPLTDSAGLAAAARLRAFPTAATPPYQLSGMIENARMRLVENRRQMNQNAVELHKKFAISVACVVFVLIGAPIALRFPRGGVGLVIGVSLVVFGVYYVGLIAGETLADRDFLGPFWAMWAANILLTIVGLVLLARMGRESATARGGDLTEMMDMVRQLFRRRRGDEEVPPSGRPPTRDAGVTGDPGAEAAGLAGTA